MRGGAAGSAQTGRDVHAAGTASGPAALSARATDTAAAVETGTERKTERGIKLPETKVRPKQEHKCVSSFDDCWSCCIVMFGTLWSCLPKGITTDSVNDQVE